MQQDNYYYVKLGPEDTAPVGTVLYQPVKMVSNRIYDEARWTEYVPVYTVVTTSYRDVHYRAMAAVMEDYAHPSVAHTRVFKGLYTRKERRPTEYQMVYAHDNGCLSLGGRKESLVEARNGTCGWGDPAPLAMFRRNQDGLSWELVTDYTTDDKYALEA